jgi:hypothetical protein
MANWPGPYAIEFTYVALTREHSSELNCIAVGDPAPGTAIASISLATRSGGSVALQTGVQNYWNWYRIGHGNTSSLLSWTLWKYNVGTLEKTFVNAGTVTNPLGSGGTATPFWQDIITFRTAGGNILNVEWMEGVSVANNSVVLTPSAVGDVYQKTAAYLLSSEGWAFGRDDTWPIAALKRSSGQNEALWRKVNRPNA